MDASADANAGAQEIYSFSSSISSLLCSLILKDEVCGHAGAHTYDPSLQALVNTNRHTKVMSEKWSSSEALKWTCTPSTVSHQISVGAERYRPPLVRRNLL